MPNIKGWSRSEVTTLANMLDLNTSFIGYGYVVKSSIKEGDSIESDTLEVELEDKYKKEEDNSTVKDTKKN